VTKDFLPTLLSSPKQKHRNCSISRKNSKFLLLGLFNASSVATGYENASCRNDLKLETHVVSALGLSSLIPIRAEIRVGEFARVRVLKASPENVSMISVIAQSLIKHAILASEPLLSLALVFTKCQAILVVMKETFCSPMPIAV